MTVTICKEMLVKRNKIRFFSSKIIDCCFFFQDDTTWFGSELPLNRRHILDSIEQKTKADYEQEHAEQREQYQRAKSAWPHVTEYSDKFVLGTRVQQQQKTEYVKKDRSHQDSNLESPAP